MAMKARSGGRILVDQLLVHGADMAFCVPGESYLEVLDALHDSPQIKLVNSRHEAGAANMADAYGKLTGKPGIAMVTRGPGACQASVGVHTAYQDSTPMILLVGQVGRDMMDREAFQEIDYRQMFGPVAKWAAQIDLAERIPEYMARAFHVATSGRPGPVVLALPEDMLTDMASVPDADPYHPVHAAPGAGDLIEGFAGNDILRGLDGADTLNGYDDDDSLYGGLGDDSLDGGSGDDVLWDLDGANTLKGGGGDDFLAAAGASRLTGGGGSDQLIAYAMGGTTTRIDGGNGTDLAILGVRDFNQAVDARVSVSGGTVTYSGTQGGLEFEVIGKNLEIFFVTGSNLGDRITGSSASEYIVGGFVNPNSDDDPGVYEIVADIGGDTLSGGGGDDYIVDGGTDPSLGADLLDGGKGADVLYVTGGHDTLIGGGGDDGVIIDWTAIDKDLDLTLKAAGAQGYKLRGDGDHSARLFDIEAMQFAAGSGDDRIVVEIKSSYVSGGLGRDTLIGSSGRDGLDGGGGNDRLAGGKGDDYLSGGEGTDTAVFQGKVSDYDVLENSYGDFHLVDTRKGSPTGRDEVRDVELFEFSDRTVSSATIADGAGLYRAGADDPDVFKGTGKADWFLGYGGNDTLRGENGDDTLDGGDGKDLLVGGDGNDEVIGGLGNDLIKTGDGRDVVYFNDDFGRDVVDDFTDDKDILSFENHTKIDRFKDLSIKQDGRDVVIRVGDDRIVLSDTKLKSLDADDFLF